MQLSLADWVIIVAYFAVALGIGLVFSRRAGKNLTEYFASGRSLPWWIAGTSMVATTFAADTPLAVTGLTAKDGLAGNWFWWAFALGGMFTVFVYARLWRRAEVLTDVELVELRYGGRPAAVLRGFRAIYVALLVNSIIIGWVTGAMLKVLKFTVFSGVTGAGNADWVIIVAMLLVVGVYSILSGLWGVAITDFFQFFLAMGACIMLAVVAVAHLGGVSAMQERVIENFAGGEQAFRYLPDFFGTDPWMPLNVFLLMLFVQWWATWYPGAEPGGGGYVVQRMASCKDERHSLLATLWFQVAHYCVRPWPWLMISFVALALYPDLRTLDDPGVGFPMVIRDLAPAGLRGLMLVAFFAAFMSTISTQMNWGASYLVNDLYKRFIVPGASDRHVTMAARVASGVVLVVGGVTAWFMKGISVDTAWKILAALGAGTGAVYMLRWFWWRINAWSEIAAMAASLLYFAAIRSFVAQPELWYRFVRRIGTVDQARFLAVAETLNNDTYIMAIVAGLTVVTWLAATYLTPPESSATLESFYRKVRPAGAGWKPVASNCRDIEPDGNLGLSIAAAVLAASMVYLVLPAVGLLLFGRPAQALFCLGGAAACGVAVYALMNSMGWERVVR